jgi:hypothetical protein
MLLVLLLLASQAYNSAVKGCNGAVVVRVNIAYVAAGAECRVPIALH